MRLSRWDILAVGGAACVAYGAGMIHPAAGWIVGGVFALVMGMYGDVGAGRRAPGG